MSKVTQIKQKDPFPCHMYTPEVESVPLGYCHISYHEISYFLWCVCQNPFGFIRVAPCQLDKSLLLFQKTAYFWSKHINMSMKNRVNHDMKGCAYMINHVTKVIGLWVTYGYFILPFSMYLLWPLLFCIFKRIITI